MAVESCQLANFRPQSIPRPLSKPRMNSPRRSVVPFVPSATLHPVGHVERLNAMTAPDGTTPSLNSTDDIVPCGGSKHIACFDGREWKCRVGVDEVSGVR